MVRINSSLVRFKKQNYQELKKFHNEQSTLFTDPSFPAIDSIIGTSSMPANIEWKRPGEICNNPKLFEDIEKSRIVRPGEFSCNWFVSACAILADVSELRNRVIPDYWEQEWNEKYCGIFHFRLWRFGRWHDVVVDDLLPTVESTLLTTQAEHENEFWTALLEKAYAKLHGSYDGLREGELCDALVDFTGGVSEVLDLRAEQYNELEEKRSHLLEILIQEISEHTIICLNIDANLPSDIGTRTDLGLCRGHAYHVTDVKKVYLGETGLRNLFKSVHGHVRGREKVAMVRLRDPRQEGKLPPGSPQSGGSGEFVYSTGTLARLKSRNLEWQKVKDTERHRLGLFFRDQMEFWMPLEDVLGEFCQLTLCRLVNENIYTVGAKRKWRTTAQVGRWQPPHYSGGGDTSIESFLKNPQYVMDVKNETELMVQLVQYHSTEGMDSPTDNRVHLLIGFHIIKVEENRMTKLHKLWAHCPVVVTEDHRRKREVNYRGQLGQGRYLVIPSTYKPGEKAQFLLRIFSKTQLDLREMLIDVPSKTRMCSCLAPDLELVTVIIVNSAESLYRPQTWGSSRLNVYCVICCEGRKVKTDIAKEEAQPTWDTAFIFYRKRPDKSLNVQVFNHNALFPDELVGECEVAALVSHSLTPLSAPLQARSKAPNDLPSVGTINLTILTEDNLMAV